MKKIYSLFAGLMMASAVWAQVPVAQPNQIIYQSNSKLGETTTYWTEGNVKVDAFDAKVTNHTHGLKGLPSTDYGMLTFDGPVTCVGTQAFIDANLKQVILPNTVRSIGAQAFAGNKNLVNFHFPDSLEEIGKEAFTHTGITEVVLPNTVRSIGNQCFEECTSITTAWLSEAITRLPSQAFRHCYDLQYIYLGKNLQDVGQYPFVNDMKIHTIWCEADNAPTVAGLLFGNYTEQPKIAKFYVPCRSNYENTGWNIACKNIYSTIFYRAGEKLKEVNDPTLSGLHKNAFGGVIEEHEFLPERGMGYIVLAEGDYTKIDSSAFRGCTAMTSVHIPAGVDTIGSWAFGNCTGLTTIEVPASVNYIEDYAFNHCTGLKYIVCKGNPATCSDMAFRGVAATIPVYVPETQVSAYKKATGWKNFSNIIRMDEMDKVRPDVIGYQDKKYVLDIFKKDAGNLTAEIGGTKYILTDFLKMASSNIDQFVEQLMGYNYTYFYPNKRTFVSPDGTMKVVLYIDGGSGCCSSVTMDGNGMSVEWINMAALYMKKMEVIGAVSHFSSLLFSTSGQSLANYLRSTQSTLLTDMTDMNFEDKGDGVYTFTQGRTLITVTIVDGVCVGIKWANNSFVNKDIETGLEGVQSAERKVQSVKVLRNGQLVIERAGAIYNAQGVRL